MTNSELDINVDYVEHFRGIFVSCRRAIY